MAAAPLATGAILSTAPDDQAFEEDPCTLCGHFAKCRADLLACSAFATFVFHGGRRWRGIHAREPSAKIYAEIFGGAHRVRGKAKATAGP
jgi:hypothetical protein